MKETRPASAKLGRRDAVELLKQADRFLAMKGRNVREFTPGKGTPREEMVAAALGPTGNLRAPALVVGKTLLVGFDEDTYRSVFR